MPLPSPKRRLPSWYRSPIVAATLAVLLIAFILVGRSVTDGSTINHAEAASVIGGMSDGGASTLVTKGSTSPDQPLALKFLTVTFAGTGTGTVVIDDTTAGT